MIRKFVMFRLGGEDFGIGIEKVVEILRSQKTYELPDLPDFVTGVINVRKEIIPVIDMRKRFGLASSSNKKKERILIARFETEKVGLMVDQVEEIAGVESSEISRPPRIFKGLRTEYLTGLTRRNDRVFILLNTESLFTSEEKIQLTATAETPRPEKK